MRLRAPFPYFGAKSHVAREVWRRFGAVDHYVEPCCGSCAVLLGRPGWRPGLRWRELINDADGLLVNAWRATQADPEAVCRHADWPVTELDLQARHRWLCDGREVLTEQLLADPNWYDARAAGWWIWGAACWLGQGWGWRGDSRQIPSVSPAGCRGTCRLDGPEDLKAAAMRLRHVKIICGDWSRAVTPAVLGLLGPDSHSNGVRVAGIFCDPPYGEGASYAVGDGAELGRAVWSWAVEAGADPRLRVAVCGLDDGREVPPGWSVYAWDRAESARGAGYGNAGDGTGRAAAARERIWFSPGCLSTEAQLTLLEEA